MNRQPWSYESDRSTGTLWPDAFTIIADTRTSTPIAASVIVPTRQRAALVGDTIEALFAQDVDRAIEIIVVDNASDDGTPAVLEEHAARAPCDFLAIRMNADEGPANSRNVALAHARGSFVAFTDSDCLPSPGWLRACIAALESGADVVQGRTEAPPWQQKPLFSHFIETTRADGSYSTSNVAYRREILERIGGFDPTRDYWEDVDLGWRAIGAGARDMFSEEALVYHQVIPQGALAWLWHATKFSNWPEKAAVYPAFRRRLFLHVWVDWFHALISLAALGLLASIVNRRFAALVLPYAVMFPFRRGLRGRLPVIKAAAHVSRDSLAFAALLWGSVRHRSIVL